MGWLFYHSEALDICSSFHKLELECFDSTPCSWLGVQLMLNNNELEGEIPSEFGKLSQLQDLRLHFNHLTSGIPNSNNSKKLTLYHNQFSGVIPQSLGINSSGIPPDIGRCTTLVRLRLNGNNLTGPLPHFTRNSSLTFVDLSENNINGAIPSSLGNRTNLTNVILSHNNLYGIIPFELGNLVNLQKLNLSHNKLGGSLPLESSNCKKMQYFDAGFNSLNGSFPSSLRTWTGPFDLHLGGNDFGGHIPRSIGELHNLLYELNLSANELTGEIPPEIGKLKSSQSLDISLNNLTGKIEVVEDLSSLTELNISYNSFSGPLPDTLWHIIGRGAHGVIYKVEFDQDNVFVIKKFPFSDNNDRITSMTTEIKTTAMIEHRNLTIPLHCNLSLFLVQVGYIAPENAYSTVMSTKSDVYSYGVVLLELISRKKVVDDPSFVEGTDLVGWVTSTREKTKGIDGIVDSGLEEELLASNLREEVEQMLRWH
ncbi:hypothetical protein ACSQ67_023950 [Phaseolus vulgaris]